MSPSTRRQRQAEATRQDILQAARKLFVAEGYAGTSMTAIAKEADVAIQTLYTSVGTKPEILLALNELIESEAGVQEYLVRMQASDDAEELVGLYVTACSVISQRCGDIIWTLLATAPSEPDIERVVQDGFRRHDHGARMIATKLAEGGSLRAGLSEKRAGDMLSLMAWHETYRRMTEEFGWTFAELEIWLEDMLKEMLLTPAALGKDS